MKTVLLIKRYYKFNRNHFFFPEQFHTLLIVDKRGINDDTQSTTVLIYIFRNSLYFHNKIKKGPALGRASQHFLLRAFAP